MRIGLGVALLFCTTGAAFAAKDVPVPTSCTPQVNAGLAQMIAQHPTRDIDNVMACGIATQRSRVQRGGPHGSHHVTTIAVTLPDGQKVNVQIVTNDDLDGPVVVQVNDPVFAYGQGYISHGLWAAGIHDTHCSTHRGADNGWVVVAGVKTPKSCPNTR
ncbi:hypothetical protein DYQ86_02815 [Acidobacteria bacterium AB60]|nr:hypothetical protein DYQ86_02815 [Acidobacteria bacterium AB60]